MRRSSPEQSTQVQQDVSYFQLHLEVPFDFGEDVEIDQDLSHLRHGRRPFITIDLRLIELPISNLTTTYGIYLATPKLAAELDAFTGLRERQFTLGFDSQMEELGEFEGKKLPNLVCFEVTGTYSEDDFAHVEGVPGLLISDNAWSTVSTYDLGDADLETYEP